MERPSSTPQSSRLTSELIAVCAGYLTISPNVSRQATQKLVPKKCFAHNAKELEVVKKKGIR